MQRILGNLYIGSDQDYKNMLGCMVALPRGEWRSLALQDPWAVVHAAKEPYHRQLLGYTGRGAPKDHPEYLFAIRGDRMFCNLIDGESSEYIDDTLIDTMLHYIHHKLYSGYSVLVHCNHGISRSPTIALLYLIKYHPGFVTNLDGDGIITMMQRLYSLYQPAEGMKEYLHKNYIRLQKT